MGLVPFTRGVFTCLGVHARKRAGLPAAAACCLWSNNNNKYSQSADSHDLAKLVCYPLPHRALLKIHGTDTSPFLQGLITNDMGLLEEPGQAAAMYAHMLNVQGRTLYDVMLYR